MRNDLNFKGQFCNLSRFSSDLRFSDPLKMSVLIASDGLFAKLAVLG